MGCIYPLRISKESSKGIKTVGEGKTVASSAHLQTKTTVEDEKPYYITHNSNRAPASMAI
jgi:hypothetical protein